VAAPEDGFGSFLTMKKKDGNSSSGRLDGAAMIKMHLR